MKINGLALAISSPPPAAESKPFPHHLADLPLAAGRRKQILPTRQKSGAMELAGKGDEVVPRFAFPQRRNGSREPWRFDLLPV